MNVCLWILQILLALHTAMGAFWKFTNGPETVPSLLAIPPLAWKAVSVFELLCAMALVAPLVRGGLGGWVPAGALGVAGVMVVYCGIHFASGHTFDSQIVYWAIVMVVCAVVAVGRRRQPLA